MQATKPLFPPIPLAGVGIVLAATIVFAVIGRLHGFAAPPPGEPIERSALIRFADQPDGAIAVSAASDGHVIAMIAPRSNDFLRATIHSLAYGRALSHLGPDLPFRLTMWRSGRFTLEDPATGWHIDLEAFGATNAAAFVPLLGDGRTS
ncbi:MAG: photosynthetic complex assembly protein PuhC [Acidibrevibacterium sp.]|uniref:photosynthetic complex assembly protein PuhC n=1 Tax=Acidibrevibacterium sp. TaxID=2606776 RepID=UPI003D0253CC